MLIPVVKVPKNDRHLILLLFTLFFGLAYHTGNVAISLIAAASVVGVAYVILHRRK